MYLFNPENDLALAHFSASYTPPASAVRMAEELAVLPIWYAGEDAAMTGSDVLAGMLHAADGPGAAGGEMAAVGSSTKGDAAAAGSSAKGEEEKMVIADGELNRSFLDAVKKVLPVQAALIPFSGIACYPRREITPWGWNPALRRKLLLCGAEEGVLPSLEELIRLRSYSSRRHAVELLHALQTETEGFCGESCFFTESGELYGYLQSIPGNKVLKMPVSGSGKGLIWILGGITDKQRDWCRRVIREQGGVVAEPVLRKVQDFAMEFYLHRGEVRFAGYSMFNATASGAYMGNELLSDRRIEEKLSKYVPVGLLYRLSSALAEKLPGRFPFYSGYAGIDMMICETGEGYRIHPCVEINLRMNMGMVARLFYERYMHPGAEGKFGVAYFKRPASALSFHRKMQREFPLAVEEGKILSGYLSLTPVTADTRYTASVIAG